MGPLPLLQEEAEALLELQGRLQEAQDTTEALRVQVGPGPRGRGTGALVGGPLRQGLVRAHALSDGWGGVGQLGVQEVQLQGLRGALRQLQQETEQNCRRELQQVHGQLAGEAWGLGLMGWPRGLGFPSQQPAPPGLRARMASLRQGCGDLRGLVSTFTQSCQGSLSEARGQVRTTAPLYYVLSILPCPAPGSCLL